MTKRKRGCRIRDTRSWGPLKRILENRRLKASCIESASPQPPPWGAPSNPNPLSFVAGGRNARQCQDRSLHRTQGGKGGPQPAGEQATLKMASHHLRAACGPGMLRWRHLNLPSRCRKPNQPSPIRMGGGGQPRPAVTPEVTPIAQVENRLIFLPHPFLPGLQPPPAPSSPIAVPQQG